MYLIDWLALATIILLLGGLILCAILRNGAAAEEHDAAVAEACDRLEQENEERAQARRARP